MIAVLLAAVMLAAAAPDKPTSNGMPKPALTHGALPRIPAKASEGEHLYAVYCSSCHGEYLQGTAGIPPTGTPIPPLIGVGAAAVDFMLSTGRMPAPAPDIQAMQGPVLFTPQQIAAIVDFVTSHGGGSGPPIPRVHPSTDVVRGRALFESDCQQCHSPTGIGNAAGFGWLAQSLKGANPVQIAEAVRFGPGIMPKFNEHNLDPNDLDAVIAYVTGELQHPNTLGGWEIGETGPVGEGLVAWILGLGSITLMMRWLGEKL